LVRSLHIGTGLPTFRADAADRTHATFMPDTAWPAHGPPPDSLPGPSIRPGSDVNYHISTLQQWFTRVRLPGPHL